VAERQRGTVLYKTKNKSPPKHTKINYEYIFYLYINLKLYAVLSGLRHLNLSR